MFRILITSIALTTALSTPPALAQGAAHREVRVSTNGMSSEQMRAEIVKASLKVCRTAVRGDNLAPHLRSACLRRAVRSAVAQVNDPALLAYHAAHPIQLSQLGD